MISPLILEQSGRWRYICVAAILAAAALPVLPLVVPSLSDGAPLNLGTGFGSALSSSFVTAMTVAVVALIVGLPAGVAIALYQFRGRAILMTLILLPAVAPSFLWAIAWSALAGRTSESAARLLDTGVGPVLAFLSLAVPLVTLAALAATRSLSASQVEAARIAGGESVVMRYAMRDVLPVATLAAVLAGALTLSDPGPGLIFGKRTAASELLTSFSALYDFALAGRQCLALGILVMLITTPVVLMASPRLAGALLARQVRGLTPISNRRAGYMTAGGVVLLVSILLLVPVIGLMLPLTEGIDWPRTSDTLQRTATSTLIYAVGTGLLASIAGILLSACAGRVHRLRQICLAVSLIILALPPALAALGIMRFSAAAPSWTDTLFRSRMTVCACMAQRLFPIGLLLGLRAFSGMSPSWAFVAATHGIPLATYIRRVVVPLLVPTAIAAALLAALFTSADITTVLLLHPPGEPSLALAVFTVMANAPESLVASLCAAYLLAATLLLLSLQVLLKGAKR